MLLLLVLERFTPVSMLWPAPLQMGAASTGIVAELAETRSKSMGMRTVPAATPCDADPCSCSWFWRDSLQFQCCGLLHSKWELPAQESWQNSQKPGARAWACESSLQPPPVTLTHALAPGFGEIHSSFNAVACSTPNGSCQHRNRGRTRRNQEQEHGHASRPCSHP